MADMEFYQLSCFFCGMGWGACVCEFASDRTGADDLGDLPDDVVSFTYAGTQIVSPNIDSTSRFFVDPYAYYGQVFVDWWSRTRHLFRRKECTVCGLPKNVCHGADLPKAEGRE